MNIVSIGGGDRTPAIKRSLELSDSPSRVLIIPSAASTEASFTRKVKRTQSLFEGLGLKPDLLHDFNETPSKTRLQHEIGRAGLIYTIGGNMPYLIRKMAEHGTANYLKDAIMGGTVHVGTSAGAMLPFRTVHSNISSNPSREEWDFEYLKPGIDLIDAVVTAHADQHDPTPYGDRSDSRMDALLNTFPSTASRAFAIDNNASVIFGDNPSIVRAEPSADVHYISQAEPHKLTSRIADPSDLTL